MTTDYYLSSLLVPLALFFVLLLMSVVPGL